MTGPLSSVRVIEVANMIAAPSAAALLADMGADVIKVEPPTGDILRGSHRPLDPAIGPGPHPDGYFAVDNRGKRSVVADLSRPEGIALVHRLVQGADIFVTNLTTERLARYRLRAGDLRPLRPALVYASLSGYGSSGPLAGTPAYDMTAFFARGGVSSVLGEPGGPPPAFRPGQGDHTTALALLSAMLVALRERDRTGAFQEVEVALFQVATWTLASDYAVTLVDGAQPAKIGRHDWPNPLTCRYRCADDRWFTLCMPGPRDYWDRVCIALDRMDWVTDPRYAEVTTRLEHAAELIVALDEVFGSRPLAHWAARFDEAGVIWGPAQLLPEVIADGQAEALGMFPPIEDPACGVTFRTVAAPFRVHGADIGVRGPAPTVGEHRREVLRELGYGDAEIDELEASGVIRPAPDA